MMVRFVVVSSWLSVSFIMFALVSLIFCACVWESASAHVNTPKVGELVHAVRVKQLGRTVGSRKDFSSSSKG